MEMSSVELKVFNKMQNVSVNELVSEFKLACRNGDKLSVAIQKSLLDMASNMIGFDMLRTMIAMIVPYSMCASSLHSLVKTISSIKSVSLSQKVEKAKRIVYMYSCLGVKNKSFLDIIAPKVTRSLLLGLKTSPVVFDLKSMPSDILTKGVFTEDPVSLVYFSNLFWNESVANSIESVLPLLRERMLTIELGDRSSYLYDSSGRTSLIRLNLSPVSAYCFEGTCLGSFIGTDARNPFVHSCRPKVRSFSSDFALFHEMSHHFMIVLNSDTREGVDEIIPFLRELRVDSTYILELPGIFTGFNEFQNITGITVKEGKLCYNRYSEGAYVVSKLKCMGRCSHISKRFFNVPVELVRVLRVEAERQGFKICSDNSLYIEDFVSWKGF
ncbi:MAG: hypothetical protein IJ730_07815 [Alphaproteobacteria bacterium]|nr:hypothetical protein [Alphaproteobacteria bacterium]